VFFQNTLINLGKFLGMGLIWLFLLSTPVGYQKSLFNLGYYYIVDTPPVHFVIDKIKFAYLYSKLFISNYSDKVVDKVDVRLQKAGQKARHHIENVDHSFDEVAEE
jgi:hypothetical protein